MESLLKTLIAVMLGITVVIAVVFGSIAHAQNVPQVTYGISFLGSGVYNQTTAVDNIVGYQLTTNLQLEADLLTAPGGGVSDYEGGATYNLCGIKAVEDALAGTSANCGKIAPFVGGTVGYSRVQQGSSPTQDGPAFMAKAGINIPSASGVWAIAAVVGYGDFGSAIPGQSNKGIFFNIPLTFGAGSNLAATDAKLERIRHASEKKAARHLKSACKNGDKLACDTLNKRS